MQLKQHVLVWVQLNRLGWDLSCRLYINQQVHPYLPIPVRKHAVDRKRDHMLIESQVRDWLYCWSATQMRVENELWAQVKCKFNSNQGYFLASRFWNIILKNSHIPFWETKFWDEALVPSTLVQGALKDELGFAAPLPRYPHNVERHVAWFCSGEGRAHSCCPLIWPPMLQIWLTI